MVYYSVLGISFFLLALIIRLNRFVFYAVAEYSVSLLDKLIADIDEDIKIKQVQKETNRLVVSLIKMMVVIIVAFVSGSIPILIYCIVKQIDCSVLEFSSFYVLLSFSIGATIPLFIPIGKKNDLVYSELSQLLHRIAMDNYNIAYKLFRKETKKIVYLKLKKRNDFVIISGLARAGTTSLMNDLSKINEFVSLNYANMPFVMCPNYWARFYKPKSLELSERSHKDRIMIGLDSNEALEEYFFKVKANDDYIKDYFLVEYKIPLKDYKDYLDYQTIIKLDNNKIYLAKNNNFILRYKSIREFNDNFIMVILYRDPLTHSASLLEKHLEYKMLQNKNSFVLDYMNWLGHHEFGGNQKPFAFNNTDENLTGDKESLDYWLKSWINYYSYALTIDHPNTLLINYDTYCKDPQSTVANILQKAGIVAELLEYKPFINKRKVELSFSKVIYNKALEIHAKMNNHLSFNRKHEFK